MGNKKVFIGWPIYFHVDPFFFCSTLGLVKQLTEEGFTKNGDALKGEIRPVIGDSAVGRSRNAITADFLESDCTHLLFIDSDLVFSFEQVKRILTHDALVVGGLYPRKTTDSLSWIVNTLDTLQADANGLIPMRYVGTGFLCIHRSVFERMIEVFGEDIWYVKDPDHKKKEYDFWKMGVYKYKDLKAPDGQPLRRWLSEDWWFCQMCHDLNIPVYADSQIILKHSGNTIFPTKEQEKQFIRPVASPEAKDNTGGDVPISSPVEQLV